MSRVRTSNLFVGAALALLGAGPLAGCGTTTTVRVQGRVVRLELDEYRIVPQSVSVPAGRITIIAVNHGILTHDVAVERGHPDLEGRAVLGATGIIMPGASGSVTVTVPRPGRYELRSTIANQADLGMYGALIVR
jgi:plastocyanin